MSTTVIEPVRRSFALLEALSRRRSTTVGVLTEETGLPRPTVLRLLQTLMALGYVARLSRQQGYRLTDRVLGLSESIRFVDHLVDAAIPHMSRFTADHGWPLYLATLSYGAITIRHSTAPESPLAFEGAGLNSRRPVLASALGRVWLAFCGEEERRSILRDIGGLSRQQEVALNEALARVSREGVAFTQPPRPTRLHGMAVPVRQHGRADGRVIASLSMRFPRSAMTEQEVALRFGRRLQTLARAIAVDTAKRTR
ncbi:transcriptional regulator, IclR family [Enhydrobacter aerosaccus]|uniref:Transcriptional regulator, IclR family n=1 Tax=Enhydrobacter aerosaccus TaxID=225324 RepID=A0A1T4TE91_9HYPH|nr:helix-turn-helix domain-containing protein [Enhydrobacter aerosaccus]SKA38753.1 transcriptional regulator, IclR family [Enhydrobacter aerosaccus]